jgi:hypothetical protein
VSQKGKMIEGYSGPRPFTTFHLLLPMSDVLLVCALCGLIKSVQLVCALCGLIKSVQLLAADFNPPPFAKENTWLHSLFLHTVK